MASPVPYSYRQYAGNGTNKGFAVPFPYLEKAHVRVYLGFNLLDSTFTTELAETTGFIWTSGTAIQTVAAPATGATLTVIRRTPNGQQLVEWQDGSSLISADLNTSDLQNLYVIQEQQDRNDAGITQSTAANTAATAATTAANAATTAANAATTAANTATSTANTALTTANTASTNASGAVTTANTASTNASAAVATANTAASNASTALSTANTAASNASTALSTANTAAGNASTALSTANTAASNASTALATANTASTNATTAVSTANTASTNASSAVSTAGTASSNASTALSTANTANSKADQAISAVSNSINYTLVANVAGIPATPANETYVEVGNSTGIESFTPLAGKPAGFVGDSGLSVRIRYTTAGATWNWQNYYTNNAETRYLRLAGGTLTGPLTLSGAPTANLQAATKLYTDTALGVKLDTTTAASTYAPLASPTFTGTPTVPGYLTTAAAASTYLTTATAGTTYQTQAGMSNYLPTSSFATQAEAVAGTSSTTVMTPERTLQAIRANPTGVSLGLAIALG
jgi:chemotaxis protein histidine kinase CheA